MNPESDNYLVEIHGDIVLTPLFWDCECKRNFVHPKSEITCDICSAERDDQPDSRANEILALCPELLTEEQRRAFAEAIDRIIH